MGCPLIWPHSPQLLKPASIVPEQCGACEQAYVRKSQPDFAQNVVLAGRRLLQLGQLNDASSAEDDDLDESPTADEPPKPEEEVSIS